MRKFFNVLGDWIIVLISLLFGWMAFSGSAKTIALYLIILGTIIYIINELTKE